jgi:hypothetical protein
MFHVGKFTLEFEEDTQFGKLIILIMEKMIYKGENYSLKLQKNYFCNKTKKRVNK